MNNTPEFTRVIPQPVWLVMFLIDLVLSAGIAFYGLSVYENSMETQKTTQLNLYLTCKNAQAIQQRIVPQCDNILKENHR